MNWSYQLAQVWKKAQMKLGFISAKFLCSNSLCEAVVKEPVNWFQYTVSVSNFNLALSWLLGKSRKVSQMIRKLENKSKIPYKLRWPYFIEYKNRIYINRNIVIC